MYSIMDAVVDHYYTIVDQFGDKIEELENSIFIEKSDNLLAGQIQELKKEILKIRRSVYPVRDIINRLIKSEISFLDIKTDRYLRDLYDHIVHVVESVDLYREMIWGLMDMNLTIISNRMNEVMKLLTIISTIFIPLTFIAGIYGMNFRYMPELEYKYSYFILWGVMIVLVVLMLIYFRKKRWI